MNIEEEMFKWKLSGVVDLTNFQSYNLEKHLLGYLFREQLARYHHNDLYIVALKRFKWKLGDVERQVYIGDTFFLNNVWGDVLSTRLHGTHEYCKIFKEKC